MAETVIVAIIVLFFVFAALTLKYSFGSRQEINRLVADVVLPERESSLSTWSPQFAKHAHRVLVLAAPEPERSPQPRSAGGGATSSAIA